MDEQKVRIFGAYLQKLGITFKEFVTLYNMWIEMGESERTEAYRRSKGK